MWFFFFKQKTAYEWRIRDWSSDVCSSELVGRHVGREDMDLQSRLEPGPGLGEQFLRLGASGGRREVRQDRFVRLRHVGAASGDHERVLDRLGQLGSESCRERVCQYV